jgi:hypothetical protein
MYYLDLFRTLNERNVRYLVVGGLAVNLYGVPRVTQDVDDLITMKRASGRKQDLCDIELLERISGNELR